MEYRLFSIAVSAAKRHSLAGCNGAAMEYLRIALGHANAMKSQRGRSAVMSAMNAIRAAEKRKSATPYADRAAVITRMERKAMMHNNTLFLGVLGGLCIAFLSAAFAIGLSLPMPATGSTFDVIEMHGQESDIVEYDVSLSDCVAIVGFARAERRNVSCAIAR